jgi:hypothetical protein
MASGTQSYTNLTIANQPGTNFQDYDWYKWTMGSSGSFTATVTVTAAGPLELHLFTVNSLGTLVELSNTSGTGMALSAGVPAGEVILVEVKGVNTTFGTQTQAMYNMTETKS